MLDILLLAVVTFVVPIILDQSNKRRHFEWVGSWLREAWAGVFAFFVVYVFWSPTGREIAMKLHPYWRTHPIIGYVVSGVLGALIFCAYWRFVGGISLAAPESLPDASLRFVMPKDPGFEVWNESDQVLREAKYGFILMDLDVPGTQKVQGVLIPDVLPIPAYTYAGDFLRPHDNFIPRQLVAYFPAVQAIVRNGHRVFGLATITCPNCIKERKYWLYFVYGEGGWYYEIPDAPKAVQIPLLGLVTQPDETFGQLAPIAERVPIGNP